MKKIQLQKNNYQSGTTSRIPSIKVSSEDFVIVKEFFSHRKLDRMNVPEKHLLLSSFDFRSPIFFHTIGWISYVKVVVAKFLGAKYCYLYRYTFV